MRFNITRKDVAKVLTTIVRGTVAGGSAGMLINIGKSDPKHPILTKIAQGGMVCCGLALATRIPENIGDDIVGLFIGPEEVTDESAAE
jgi:hypothetical protein